MERINILGKNYQIEKRQSSENTVKLTRNRIIIESRDMDPDSLLKEFMTNYLHSKLEEILEQINRVNGLDIFGDLDFEIVEKIDNKRERIAKLKGRKILIKLNAISLPEEALKYIISHELAHILTKRHTKRFWKIVAALYPKFETGKKLFEKFGYNAI